MAKAKVKRIYLHSLKLSEKEDIQFELYRWVSEYKTIYEMEVYRVKTIKENVVFPVFNEYKFENLEQLLLSASSDGEAINLAVEVYNRYKKMEDILRG